MIKLHKISVHSGRVSIYDPSSSWFDVQAIFMYASLALLAILAIGPLRRSIFGGLINCLVGGKEAKKGQSDPSEWIPDHVRASTVSQPKAKKPKN